MRERKTEIGLVLVGAIILCFSGFYNNFPLVFSDSADYLSGAFGWYIPIDRPVFYGIFLRIASLNTSLWLAILVQGILMSYLLFETFGIFYSGNKRNLLFILSVAVLTVCTGISQNTSILLPDIFSPIGILCFINLLVNNKLSRLRQIIISLILMLCVLVHFSNMLVLFSLWILVCMYAIFRHYKKRQIAITKKKILITFALVSSVFVIAPIGNYIFGKKFIISEGSHVFIMTHLVETGILEEYLKNECQHNNYKMCQYRDRIDTNFLWGGKVFGEMGGWEGSREEFNSIIFDIVTTPKYAIILVRRCIEYSFMEYFTFSVPPNTNWGVPPYIKNNYSIYGRDFCASLQTGNKLNYSATNYIQMVLVITSLAFLMFIILTPSLFHTLTSELKWFALLILVFSFLNATICANFGTMNERYQNRIIWLIPLTAFFIAEQLISGYIKTKRLQA